MTLPDTHQPDTDACKAFLALEDGLRRLHGPEHLYVRPSFFQEHDGTITTAAGWVAPDGDPAILPLVDTLLITSPEGQVTPRTLAQVVDACAAAGARVTVEEVPVRHVAVHAETLGDDALGGLLATLRGG